MSWLAIISILVSVFALTISAYTAWLTFLRKGRIKMTRPVQFYIGADISNRTVPKVHFRSLLFSTAKRGQILEDMYVKLSNKSVSKNFVIWVYGEQKLMRGAGLFVSETGITLNHHFIPLDDDMEIEFISGNYHIEIYTRALGMHSYEKIQEANLNITKEDAVELESKNTGAYYDWNPETQKYHIKIREVPDL